MRYIFWIIVWILSVYCMMGLCRVLFAAERKENVSILDIRNPFKVTIYIEVKCDNIVGTLKYRYYKKIRIPKKGGYKIIVPNNLRYCEIWALDYKIFE